MNEGPPVGGAKLIVAAEEIWSVFSSPASSLGMQLLLVLGGSCCS
jgi:hypothetical protein